MKLKCGLGMDSDQFNPGRILGGCARLSWEFGSGNPCFANTLLV